MTKEGGIGGKGILHPFSFCFVQISPFLFLALYSLLYIPCIMYFFHSVACEGSRFFNEYEIK